MLRPRIIASLLIDNNRLVKTRNFKDPKYVGDPLNAVKIFNEKQVDELIVLDISATRDNKKPNYSLIEKMAAECRMPLCYGGGINEINQAKRILSLGVEKVSLSSKAMNDLDFISMLVKEVGSQSVIVTIDVKRKNFSKGYNILTYNGKNNTKHSLNSLIQDIQSHGAGEIIINSIDRDGTMSGFDCDLIKKVRDLVKIPITALGGAGNVEDFRQLVVDNGIIGLAAGSFFVFKGKFRAVLISYPTPDQKNEFFTRDIKIDC